MYKEKYLKYKLKYLDLKGQIGGDFFSKKKYTIDKEKEKYTIDEEVIFPEMDEKWANMGIFALLKINENLKKLTFSNIREIIDIFMNNEVYFQHLGNNTITHLILSGSADDKNKQLTDEHIDTLARVLSYYKNLRYIDLTNHNIDLKVFRSFLIRLNTYDFNQNKNKINVLITNKSYLFQLNKQSAIFKLYITFI